MRLSAFALNALFVFNRGFRFSSVPLHPHPPSSFRPRFQPHSIEFSSSKLTDTATDTDSGADTDTDTDRWRMTQFAAFLPVSPPLWPPNYPLPMAVPDIRQLDSPFPERIFRHY